MKSKCLDVSKSEEFWENEQSIKVQKLNTEFEEIKRIFEQEMRRGEITGRQTKG